EADVDLLGAHARQLGVDEVGISTLGDVERRNPDPRAAGAVEGLVEGAVEGEHPVERASKSASGQHGRFLHENVLISGPPLRRRLACFAAVAPGLEALALAEARALGLPATEEEGGVAWTGDLRSVVVANVGLRIASRVLVRLDTFEAVSFAELERRARRVAW